MTANTRPPWPSLGKTGALGLLVLVGYGVGGVSLASAQGNNAPQPAAADQAMVAAAATAVTNATCVDMTQPQNPVDAFLAKEQAEFAAKKSPAAQFVAKELGELQALRAKKKNACPAPAPAAPPVAPAPLAAPPVPAVGMLVPLTPEQVQAQLQQQVQQLSAGVVTQ